MSCFFHNDAGVECIGVLLSAGADRGLRDVDGKTAEHASAEAGRDDCARALTAERGGTKVKGASLFPMVLILPPLHFGRKHSIILQAVNAFPLYYCPPSPKKVLLYYRTTYSISEYSYFPPVKVAAVAKGIIVTGVQYSHVFLWHYS